MSASILTWAEFCAEKNISPSLALSQVFPSGIVANIDNFKVAGVVKFVFGELLYSQYCVQHQEEAAAVTLFAEVYAQATGETAQEYNIECAGIFATTSNNYNNSWVMSGATTYPQNLGLYFLRSYGGVVPGGQDFDFYISTDEKPTSYLLDSATSYLFALIENNIYCDASKPVEMLAGGESYFSDYEALEDSALEVYLSYDTRMWTYGEQLATPTGLYADNITSDSARTNWQAVDNASNYKVQYKAAGDTVWTETYTD